jgi:FkbM family methyltransferase
MSSEFKLAEVKALYNLCKPYIKSFRTALDIGCDVFHFAAEMEKDFENIHCWDFRDKSSQMTRVIKDPSKISHHVTALGEDAGVKYTKPGVGRIKSDQYGGSSTLKVNVKTLDSYGLFSNIDFIKMDVEGYEPNIIRGAIKTIESNWPVILCEINRGDFTAKDLLESMGYELMGVHNKNGSPHDYLFVNNNL